jgi:hypothetical protein
MTRIASVVLMIATGGWAMVLPAADRPGPLASADAQLDYLLESWKGPSRDALVAVWGRKAQAAAHGENARYTYEFISRARAGASILGGQVAVSTGDIRCLATFEVDRSDTVVAVGRRGGGRPCRNGSKRRTPLE